MPPMVSIIFFGRLILFGPFQNSHLKKAYDRNAMLLHSRCE